MIKTKHIVAAAITAFAAQATVADTELQLDGWPDMDKELALHQEEAKGAVGVDVKPLMNDWIAHHDKLKTAMATGQGAGDIVGVDVEFIGTFANAGGLVNLSKEYGADKFENLFPAYAWNQGRALDGDIYAIPYNSGPGVMYFWRDHVTASGMSIDEITKSWDSFFEFGAKLKEKGIPLVADASIIAQTIINTTVESGNSVYFDSEDNIIVTNDRFVEAFTLAKKARDMGLDASIGSWSGEWFEALNEGTYAVEFSGAWLGGFMERWIAPDATGKWGVANLPNGIYGTWGGSFFAIPKQSKNADAAWKFMEWYLMDEDKAVARFTATGGFPPLNAAYKDPAFQEPMPYFGGQKARALWGDIASKITPVKPNKGDAVARDVVFQALGSVLNDNQDITKSLKDAEKQIKRRVRAL